MAVDWTGFAQRNQQNSLGNQLQTGINGFGQGFQIGALMRQSNALNQARELEAKKAQQLQLRTEQLQTALGDISLLTDPYERVQGLNNVMLKFPEVADKLKSQATFYSDQVKENATNQLLPALNALNLGKKDIAIDRLTSAATAFKNSGNTRGADALNAYIEDIKGATEVAPLVQSGYLTLASILGPDKLADTLKNSQDYATTQATIPETVAQAQQKTEQEKSTTAIKAEEAAQAPLNTQLKQIELKYAEPKALQEIEQRGWNIENLKNDIDYKKAQTRISAMNAALAREGNELKKDELRLKIQDATLKQDEKLRTKAADVEKAHYSMDNLLTTVDKLLKTPQGVIDSAAGTLSSKLPTVSGDVANFEEDLKTLGSQIFLSQVPNMKGLGALTEAEGQKLQASLGSLDLRQTPERLKKNLEEIQRLTIKARNNISKQYGVPETTPDIPSAATSSGGQIQPMTDVQKAATAELQRRRGKK
jgi:hypothetical protein